MGIVLVTVSGIAWRLTSQVDNLFQGDLPNLEPLALAGRPHLQGHAGPGWRRETDGRAQLGGSKSSVRGNDLL